ncbi:hypothetical protein AVEN_94860-1 [Araneus ventricosus]|uniref:Secreted protein n=1 Tax=Araneus ventricosus TaxID=182803 RepID=A0A4Y2M107_ARAVE|nr:hypothetical protein AVEN_94860-1 [Araneus ventricosus]
MTGLFSVFFINSLLPICFESLRWSAAPTSSNTCCDFLYNETLSHPHSNIYTGCISAFIARQSKWRASISRQVEYPNLLAHRSNSQCFLALTADFDMERSNLCGVERS